MTETNKAKALHVDNVSGFDFAPLTRNLRNTMQMASIAYHADGVYSFPCRWLTGKRGEKDDAIFPATKGFLSRGPVQSFLAKRPAKVEESAGNGTGDTSKWSFGWGLLSLLIIKLPDMRRLSVAAWRGIFPIIPIPNSQFSQFPNSRVS